MTYNSAEIGALGSPVEMYFFQVGTLCWPYTSSDKVQLLDGRSYNPVSISRGPIEKNDEARSNEIRVHLHADLKLCSQFFDGSTPSPMNLTIFRRHRIDYEPMTIFRGTIANAERVGDEVALICVTPLSATERSIPRELIMRTCPHVLYSPRCQLSPASWQDEGTVDLVSASTIRLTGMAAQANDYYNAGYLYKPSTGQRAFVQDHSYSGGAGHVFTLLQPIAGWAVSDTIQAFAGCGKTIETCRDKFDNVPNFGGFPLHPERNPFIDLKGN